MNKKTVLITGAYGGIGASLVKSYVKAGYNVIATGRKEVKLQELKEEIKSSEGIEITTLIVDGGIESEVIKAYKHVQKHFQKLDVLINNAQASASGKMLIEHSKEDFDLAIFSGLYATFYFMKYFYPLLKISSGCVINFASGAGLFGKVGQSSYAACKEGIRGLSRVAATEWGTDQIRVNVICPLVLTPSLEKWRQNYPEAYDKTIKDIPLGRFGDAYSDVGELCLFLSSEKAKYITGETFTLQGGSGLRP